MRIKMEVMGQLIEFKYLRKLLLWTISKKFNDHVMVIGMEIDHLSALTRRVIRANLAVHIKTSAKGYCKMIAHGNIPSSRHEMTKLIHS